MPFSRVAENRIREAIAEGKFENVPGAGEPINLDEYFSTPEDVRMAYSVLKSANCAPVEVELLKEISRLQEAIASTADETSRRSLRHTLVNRQTELAIAQENARRKPR